MQFFFMKKYEQKISAFLKMLHDIILIELFYLVPVEYAIILNKTE